MEEVFKNMLKSYKYFQECILLDLDWKHHGLVLDLVFDYVWDKSGTIRRDEKIERVIIRLSLVQEVQFMTGLDYTALDNIENLNWGMDEIAIVKIINDGELLYKYRSFDRQLFHLLVDWDFSSIEFKRNLNVIFSEMKIIDERKLLLSKM
jgi:hypothetical protein